MSARWSRDHVTPEQRVRLRRAEDRNPLLDDTHVRWGHIVALMLILLVLWLVIPPMVEEHFDRLDAERAGRMVGEVAHKLRVNCGI